MPHARPRAHPTCAVLTLAASLAVSGAVPCAAQDGQLELTALGSRTRRTGARAYGGGAQYQLTWGAGVRPVRLAAALGADLQRTRASGETQRSLSTDVTLVFGGQARLTPFVGGSVGANWMSGGASDGSSSSGAELGIQAVLGAQYQLGAHTPLAVQAELDHGYVRGQEHQTGVRLGLAYSLR